MGACNVKLFFAWDPGEGSKSQIFNFNYKDFLCVYSQMKDTNISDGIFHLSPGSCPRGGLGGA